MLKLCIFTISVLGLLLAVSWISLWSVIAALPDHTHLVILTFYGGASFVDYFFLFMFRVSHVFVSVHCSLVVNCRERADLLYVMFYCVFVTFPCGVLGQVWCLIESIPVLCLLAYLDKRLCKICNGYIKYMPLVGNTCNNGMVTCQPYSR